MNEEIEKKYIDKMINIINQFYNDEESLHECLDKVILELICELGYNKIFSLYRSLESRFWYA